MYDKYACFKLKKDNHSAPRKKINPCVTKKGTLTLVAIISGSHLKIESYTADIIPGDD